MTLHLPEITVGLTNHFGWGLTARMVKSYFIQPMCFSNHQIFCCSVHTLSWWSGTSRIDSFLCKGVLTLGLYGVPTRWAPFFPQQKAPQKFRCSSCCWRSQSPQRRWTMPGSGFASFAPCRSWLEGDFFLPQKTQLNNGTSKRTHKLNHKPFFLCRIIVRWGRKKGKMRKRYSFKPPTI